MISRLGFVAQPFLAVSRDLRNDSEDVRTTGKNEWLCHIQAEATARNGCATRGDELLPEEFAALAA